MTMNPGRLSAAINLALPAVSVRLPLLDGLRGVAVVLMAIYHGVWDADYLGLAEVPLSTSAAWLGLRALVLGLFLLFVGVNLELAHRVGIYWRSFLHRLGLVGASALVITATTWLVFDAGYVTFGVLHHIVVASILGLTVLRLPAVALSIFAVTAFWMPWIIQLPAFNVRWLAWTGLATKPPFAIDHVPLLPWIGVVLIGILIGRLISLAATDHRSLWRSWHPEGAGGQLICSLGRHSLIIYLVHQPILMGILWLLARLL